MNLWSRVRALWSRPASPPAQLAPPSNGPATDSEIFEIAEKLAGHGKLQEAVQVLGQLTARQPEDPAIALRLAELLVATRQYDRVVSLLQREAARGHGLSPSALRARRMLINVHQQRGLADAALAEVHALQADDIDQLHEDERATRGGEATASEGDGGVQPGGTVLSPAGLGERFRLGHELGRGGAGAVYQAEDRELGCEVALKLIHPALRRHGGAARLFQEARLAAAIRHPGVVVVYEVREDQNLIVMELCESGSLQQRIGGGRLPVARALQHGAELLSALEAVHQAGLIHGDLKPGNLLLRGPAQGGDLVIGDFGTARFLRDAQASSSVGGTPGYMAPERLRSEALTPAADLYAAGAVLLEMLAGALPLSRFERLAGHRLQAALPAAVSEELGPEQPRVLALLDRLLAADPTERPSAGQALQALRPPP